MSTPQASPARRTGSWKLPLLGLGVVVLLVGTLSVVESQRLEALRCRTGHCELWRGGLLGPRLATRFEAQAVASVELRVGTTKRTSTLGLRLVDGTLVRLAE